MRKRTEARQAEARAYQRERDAWQPHYERAIEYPVIRGAAGVTPVPILGSPDWLDTSHLRRFQWAGILGEGKRCHTNKVPCHTDLEKQFSDFLDRADDVLRFIKNERFGFSVTYYESNRPRQYYPDLIVETEQANGRALTWLAETKGEVRSNTLLKAEAAKAWCEKMSRTSYGEWRYLFIPQKKLESALASGVETVSELADWLLGQPQLGRLERINK